MPSVKQTLSLSDEAIKGVGFAPTAREFFYLRDDKTPGLMLRVGVTAKTWRIETERRVDGIRIGVSRNLGDWPDVKSREAHTEAIKLLGRRAEGTIGPGVRQGGSFNDGMAKYIEHLKAKAERAGKDPSWAENVEALNTKHMAPKWGGKSLMWLASNQQAMEDWHIQLSKTAPVSANHACRVIRAMYRHACKYNHQLPRDRNPTETVKWNTEDPREAAMPFDLFPSWATAVAAIPNEARRAFHMLNLLTGARPGELGKLSWDDVHLKKRQIVIRKSKTGGDIPIPLSLPIVRELRRARSYASAEGYRGRYVFPSIRGGHIRRFDSDGLTHCANALRGTFKTVAADLGIDDIVSGALMGHAPKGISQKYIGRLVLASGLSLPAAQKKISARICKLLNGL